jgi:protease-4
MLAVFWIFATGCPGPVSRTDEKGGKAKGHGKEVAVLTLTGQMVEHKTLGDLFGPKHVTLRRTLKTLRKAAADSRIGTVAIRVGDLQTGWAQIAEIKAAFSRLKRAKKRVVVHLDQPQNATYYLALGADEIQIAPSSSLWLIGLKAEVLFLRGLLDKLGIKADMAQVGKYKGAAEPLTRKSMSPELEKALTALVDGMFSTLVTEIASARGISEQEVKKLIDRAPLTAKSALGAKLVDKVGSHREQVRELAGQAEIHWEYGKKQKPGTWSGLLELIQPDRAGEPPKEPHVALVYAIGPIVYGRRQGGVFSSEEMIVSHKMEELVEELQSSENVKAVLLRINSPGGSALASDVIWKSLRKLAKKKPVVVTMGDVAASGGYYIASAGTKVYAQPLSMTGSIGVVGGKLSFGGLFEKIGITRGVITRGQQADMFSPSRPFSAEEKERIEKVMKRTYDQFIERVAAGRDMSRSAVERAAKGRVWTGRLAKKRGLVDQLGGIYDALAEARRLGKLPEDAKVTIYPRPRSWLEVLQERLGSPESSVATHGLPGAPSGLLHNLAFLSALDGELCSHLLRLLAAAAMWKRERALVIAPYHIRVR